MGHLREESGPSVITLLCDHTPKTPSCGLRHPIALPALDQGPGPECCRSTSGLQVDGRHVPSQHPGPGLVPVVSPRVRGSFSPWLPSFQIAISDWMPECHLLLVTREGSLSHVQNLLSFEDQNVDNCDVSCRDFPVLSILCWKRSGRGGLRTGASGEVPCSVTYPGNTLIPNIPCFGTVQTILAFPCAASV